jgi:hypothetical protein
MSATTTPTPTPTPAAEAAGEDRRRSLLYRVAGGASLAAILAATAIAVWPASETEKAYDDGQAFGAAVAQLQAADTTDEVDAALTEMNAAVTDTRDHAGDAVADQVADQEDALTRATDGVVGMYEADDDFEYELYEAELDTAVTDLADNAEDFRTTGPEVQQSFWEGYEDGHADAS